ncbi:MAG TPA: hypothetical protein VGE98_06480 [Thermoanaerobaculia bacterium]
MTNNEPLRYNEEEIRSFLPTGWRLGGRIENAEGTDGFWDAKKGVWRATVVDNVDFDWPVVVKGAEAASLGRIEALRRAFDKLYRDRLG